MAQIVVALLVVRICLWLIPAADQQVHYLIRQLKQKLRLSRKEILFDTNYIEIKTFYVREFNSTPCISFINNLDAVKAFNYINAGHAGKVLDVYQRNYYSWQHKK